MLVKFGLVIVLFIYQHFPCLTQFADCLGLHLPVSLMHKNVIDYEKLDDTGTRETFSLCGGLQKVWV